jgi:hypothetical protein
MAKEIKISFPSGGKLVTGSFKVDRRLITVTAPDGRQKAAQLGASPPETLARLMLLELEREKRG